MFLFAKVKRFLLGEPLSSQMAIHQLIPKWKALALLSSDALSSVAYATEEILIPLSAMSLIAMNWSILIGLAICLLLVILSMSYQQTIDAYPSGGGAYIVAKENLGTTAGLIAGASLLIDYVLTVAVSTAAGVENLASAMPILMTHKESVSALIIFLMTVFNLRGAKESASFFAFPTYLFIFSIFILIIVGFFKILMGQVEPAVGMFQATYPELPLFLILKSFSSGCSALTGVEAISNGIPLFQNPKQKNAKITLLWMSFILGILFLSITLLAHFYKIVPNSGETMFSALAGAVVGRGYFYYLIEVSTALILVLAANTSYADFPRLSSLLAKDRFLPRQLASVGDRLVFSNGILGLSFSAFILILLFQGETHHLIPLYAIGVFMSFTLSQSGMVVHHIRKKEDGWALSLLFNFLGALTTFIVLLVIGSTKFLTGAWMVVGFIPFLIFIFKRIHKHYLAVGRELALPATESLPTRLVPIKHTVVVPVSGIHRGVIEALRYALSISNDVRACYVETDAETTTRIQREWKKWASEVPFVVLRSPYRSVIAPLLEYLDDLEQESHGAMITVLIPEFITSKWWHEALHNQTAFLIRTALLFKRNKVVTSVRYHLRET